MRLRWVLALAGVATVFTGLSIAAALRYVIPYLEPQPFRFDGTEDQQDIDAYFSWVNSGAPYYQLTPWLVTAALIAVVAALALLAYRAQLAGSASATASRDASSA